MRTTRISCDGCQKDITTTRATAVSLNTSYAHQHVESLSYDLCETCAAAVLKALKDAAPAVRDHSHDAILD